MSNKNSFTIRHKWRGIIPKEIKKISDSYQKDFDTGVNRDPAYIYGPNSPRTVYFGIRFGNLL